MKSVVDDRCASGFELSEFLLGLSHLKSRFRSDALKGRKAVVFGARMDSIGAACARMLLEFGCEHVVVQAETEKVIEPTFKYLQETLGFDNCSSFFSDLSIPGSGKASAERVEAMYPGIDICLYISGLSAYYSYTTPDSLAAQRLFQLNLISAAEVWGVFLSAHLQRRVSDPSAHISLGGCSSIQALVAASDNAGFYSASKASVEQYLRGLGVQYASQGVQAICVAPGCVDTDRHRSSEHEFEVTRQIGRQTPWGKLAPPSVIAGAFLSALCTPEYHVGSMIVVDGGWSASGNVNARDQNRAV